MIKKQIRPHEKWKSFNVTKKKTLPDPFDLVLLALDNGRTIPGWWDGSEWSGPRVKKDYKIVAYKNFHGNY